MVVVEMAVVPVVVGGAGGIWILRGGRIPRLRVRRRPSTAASHGGALPRRGDGGPVTRHGGHRVPRVVHAAGGEQQRSLYRFESVLRRHCRRHPSAAVGCRGRRGVVLVRGQGRQGRGHRRGVMIVVVMVIVPVSGSSVSRVGNVHVILRRRRRGGVVLGRPALPRRRR